MKINGSNYSQFVSDLYKKNTVKKSSRAVENHSSMDRIEISKTGKEISKYVEKINSPSLTNQEKIERIKKSIKEGTYQVSSEALAQKILDRISQEKGLREEE